MNIPSNAVIQERHFRDAFYYATKKLSEGTEETINFLDLMYNYLESESGIDDEDGKVEKSMVDVMNKILDAKLKYSNLFYQNAPNIISNIKSGYVNVLDLSQVDEYVATVLVSHILRNSLQKSKDAAHSGNKEDLMKNSVFFILEEAHILAPKNVTLIQKMDSKSCKRRA